MKEKHQFRCARCQRVTRNLDSYFSYDLEAWCCKGCKSAEPYRDARPIRFRLIQLWKAGVDRNGNGRRVWYVRDPWGTRFYLDDGSGRRPFYGGQPEDGGEVEVTLKQFREVKKMAKYFDAERD